MVKQFSLSGLFVLPCQRAHPLCAFSFRQSTNGKAYERLLS
jgi:hypothetical protein